MEMMVKKAISKFHEAIKSDLIKGSNRGEIDVRIALLNIRDEAEDWKRAYENAKPTEYNNELSLEMIPHLERIKSLASRDGGKTPESAILQVSKISKYINKINN